MKIKIATTTTKEMDVTFPSFTQVGSDLFAVLTPFRVIKLWYAESINSTVITHNNTPQDAYNANFEIITSEQFFDEYERIVDRLYDDMENAKFIAKDESEYEGVNEICEHSAKMEEEA